MKWEISCYSTRCHILSLVLYTKLQTNILNYSILLIKGNLNFKGYKYIDGLHMIHMGKTEIYYDKPMYVGSCILYITPPYAVIY